MIYLSAREEEVRAFENAPVKIIAKILRIAPNTVSEYRRRATTKSATSLTADELEVIDWCSKGYVIKEVARASGMSIATVRRHKSRIYAKIGLGGFRQRVFING